MYQSSYDEYAAVTGRSGTIVMGAVGWIFGQTAFGKPAGASAAAAAAAVGGTISLSELKEGTQNDVAAIEARMDVLRAGCSK